MARFVWNRGQENERIGIAPAILDRHMRPLVDPRLVEASDPKSVLTIIAGRPFVVDHTDHDSGMNWISDHLRSHPDFACLSREALPPAAVVKAQPENTKVH